MTGVPLGIEREISDYIGRGAVLTLRKDVMECSTSFARIPNGDKASDISENSFVPAKRRR